MDNDYIKIFAAAAADQGDQLESAVSIFKTVFIMFLITAVSCHYVVQYYK